MKHKGQTKSDARKADRLLRSRVAGVIARLKPPADEYEACVSAVRKVFLDTEPMMLRGFVKGWTGK
jgi:hypothetical protein